MKTIVLFALILCASNTLSAQKKKAGMEPVNFTAFNREATYEDGIAHLDSRPGDGVLWLVGSKFENGTIELDIKGEDTPGRSFVGLAFHGKDNQTYDAIYFRPFNFKHPERSNHSIQYIAMPENDWGALRKAFPGKYENAVNPVPEVVDDWFHAKIAFNYPQVKVYINDSAQPTLEVTQLSKRKYGKIGFWVGNGSEGWFKNLEIIKKE